MAILTDLMITIDSDYDNPKYGVSKTLNNYTLNDIWNNAYVGANFPVHRMISKSTGTGTRYWSTDTTRPYTIGSLIYQWGMYLGARISASGSADDDEYKEDGIYTKTIWLYSSSSLPQTITDLASVRMVTQMDFTRLRLDFERSTGQSYGEGAPVWGDTKSYGTVKSCSYLLDNTDQNNPVWKTTGNITLLKPYQMIKVDDKICIIDALTTGYYANYAGEYYDGATPITKELVTGFSSVDNTLKFGLIQSLKKTSDSYGEIRWGESSWAVNYPSMYDNYKAYMQNRTTSSGYNQTVVYPTTQDEFQKNIMGYGVYFKTDRTYKPIIVDGYVTGYTNDLSTPSELDTYTSSSMHVVPDTKPSGGDGDNENEEIEMPLAYIGGTGGFVQFIKINSAGLASADDISAALSRFDITTIGKDLLRNFVSYKCFAVLNIDPDDTVTRQITVDGHGLTDENDQPLNGQVIGSVLPIDFTIGTPTRYFNDFRDFAPYTKIEAYVPFCGWFSLPPWCIGHKITGTMFTDLYNGTVKAVIFAGQTVVAEVGGCCAYDIPFVADATGAKAGAVISSALSTAAATAATVSIPNVATGISAVTSAANTICAINSNDTTLKGVLGDGSNLNGLLHCYLKVTRPQSPTRTNVIPDTYKHEIGIPTCKELTLTAGDGYTQIMDANIEGSMTAREKQMIIDGFRHGLIL